MEYEEKIVRLKTILRTSKSKGKRYAPVTQNIDGMRRMAGAKTLMKFTAQSAAIIVWHAASTDLILTVFYPRTADRVATVAGQIASRSGALK